LDKDAINMTLKPIVLIILDGWGHSDETEHNAIRQASPAYFESLCQNYPNTLIDGSGPAVGLPEGIMGNSEVGHMNLGAGRVVFSGLSQIYKAIEDKSFFKNESFQQAINHVKKSDGTLHLMGLLSDGAVHSHQDHLYALMELAKQNDIKRVAIHAIMDGRDTPPNDGLKYYEQLQAKIKEIGVGHVASISGRYWAMDRDKRWDRVEKAFAAITGSSGNNKDDGLVYLQKSYKNNIGDEFIEPVCIGEKTTVSKDDAFIFFNFRADRAREITHALADKEFSSFDRGSYETPFFVCMSPYEKDITAPVAFLPSYPKRTFPEIISEHDVLQLRIAETEKYAHVTFFFNGGKDIVFKGEERELIPSPREVSTYDQKPEMSAYLVKDRLIELLNQDKFGVVICNFANTDMVGHTALPEAIKQAVSVVDDCLSEIVPVVLGKGGEVIITADHGNAEQMIDDSGEPLTAHTTNLVPLILVSERNKEAKLKDGGRLCDVTPTILALLDIEKPKEMTGESLIV